MKKFWQMDAIPKQLQKVIEQHIKNAENIAKGGGIPTNVNPKDAMEDFVKDASKILEAIKESKEAKTEEELKEIPEEDIQKG